MGESTGNRWIPSPGISNMESVPMPWREHAISTPGLCVSITPPWGFVVFSFRVYGAMCRGYCLSLVSQMSDPNQTKKKTAVNYFYLTKFIYVLNNKYIIALYKLLYSYTFLCQYHLSGRINHLYVRIHRNCDSGYIKEKSSLRIFSKK